MTTLTQDLRYAVRMLAKSPGFTLAAARRAGNLQAASAISLRGKRVTRSETDEVRS